MRTFYHIMFWFLIMVSSCIISLVIGITITTSSVAAKSKISKTNIAKPMNVPVYLAESDKITHVPLEQYVLGVVAAEMPDQFSSEALKAQAIAARTYIIHKLMAARKTNRSSSFYVTDHTADQVFYSQYEMQKKWRAAKDLQGLRKIERAVQATRGLIITYKNKPIDATYFSTSNGYTENAKDYWDQSVPYLKSVASPWDRLISNRYETKVTFTYSQFASKLGIQTTNPRDAVRQLRVLSRTQGNRVKKIRIANRVLTGRQVREKLGLRSTHFVWQLANHHIEIKTFGYGHGVGMSQWGAQGMALVGYDATQILKYYYDGVQVQSLHKIWPN